ncbi:MAG: beta-hydroxyacyl-ACP dehydratase [Propionibacteriaceae bacterium]|jgi:3-hydroxyacyl-[acyl-carrier-protein] dehydratase|nr:beta-hydroxyacyl-ACP dehydratase [Propionibacteriaceae bacterium]
MDREAVKAILPHREPMLLVDEAWLEDDCAVGRYHVRGDEFFLQGHFPGNPVVPGVILCEMLGQSSCVLIEGTTGTPYFTGLDKVRFKRVVHPGDTIEFRARLTAHKGPYFFIQGTGTVDDETCLTAELSFAVLTPR